ncbi:hypothetical protein HMPREF3034_00700 [Prevotella sp. DNF00663]|nr:hypothetical protein HMPREF3034_00700 [Prevotella sp. DNF00663]
MQVDFLACANPFVMIQLFVFMVYIIGFEYKIINIGREWTVVTAYFIKNVV